MLLEFPEQWVFGGEIMIYESYIKPTASPRTNKVVF